MANEVTTQPIPRLIRRIAIPASIGFFFNTMFNVVDTLYGGLISTQALAALSLSFPVFFIIIAVGNGLSIGTTSLIANALGAGDRTGARLLAVQGITFGILVAVALTVVGLSVSPFLFSILGASGDYLATCLSYMNTIFAGTPFFILAYILNATLNAQGDTRSFRNFLIIGCLLNIILDPWFIYGGLGVPSLGIMGIALATVLIQGLGCVYLARQVFRTGLLFDGLRQDIFPRLRPLREIAYQGLPASLNMLTVGAGIFVITYFVGKFGKEAVAAYGVATRVEQIVLLPTIGLNIATLTMVAQNNGARLFQRVRETLTTALRYGAMVMGFGTVVVFLLARRLMALFTSDPAVVETGTTYLRIAAFIFYAYVILYVHVAALQGTKRPLFALWIGLFRQILAPVAVFSLLTSFGLVGIWWGIFGINWTAAFITIGYARLVLGRIIREADSEGALR
jgi:putative MATE family efflux protein